MCNIFRTPSKKVLCIQISYIQKEQDNSNKHPKTNRSGRLTEYLGNQQYVMTTVIKPTEIYSVSLTFVMEIERSKRFNLKRKIVIRLC